MEIQLIYTKKISFFSSSGKLPINNFMDFATAPPPSVTEHLPVVEAYGNIKAETGSSMELSRLDAWCLLYTHTGLGQVQVKNHKIEFAQNTLGFLDCQSYLHIKTQKAPWHYTFFFLKGGSLPFLFQINCEQSPFAYHIPDASFIHHEVMELYEQLAKGYGNYYHQSRLILDILLGTASEKERMKETNILLPDYIRRIKQRFDENCKSRYSLNSLSADYQISKYQLCREFTAAYNCSPIQYLNNLRIMAARDALIYTDKRINEIGRMVGFENTNNFIRIFKNKTGATPLHYRKEAAPK